MALAKAALLPAGMVSCPFTLANSGDFLFPSQGDAGPAARRGDILVSSSDVLSQLRVCRKAKETNFTTWIRLVAPAPMIWCTMLSQWGESIFSEAANFLGRELKQEQFSMKTCSRGQGRGWRSDGRDRGKRIRTLLIQGFFPTRNVSFTGPRPRCRA